MHVFNAGDQKTTDLDVTALNRIADFGEVSDSKGSNPGGLGGADGSRETVDFTTRQLQTGLKLWPKQGGDGSKLRSFALIMRHIWGKMEILLA